MPLPIINSIASWILKKRIHQIELFLKSRKVENYPEKVEQILKDFSLEKIQHDDARS
jgi:hypothetical protein